MGNLFDVERQRLESFESVVSVLDASCIGVLRAILRTLERNNRPLTDSIQMTESEIGGHFGRSARTVRRVVAKLKKDGLIIVADVTGSHGQRPNRYAIPWATFEAIASGEEQAVEPVTPRTACPPPPDTVSTPPGQNGHPWGRTRCPPLHES